MAIGDLGEFEDPTGYNTDAMMYFGLEDVTSLTDSSKNVGINREAEVAYRDDGTRVYVKDVDSMHSDTAQSHIAAGILGDYMEFNMPEITYDALDEKVLVEEVPGDQVVYDQIRDFTEQQLDSFHTAAAQKMLMGDADYSGNFLATDSTVSPIDYDTVGRDMITVKRTLKNAYGDILDSKKLDQEAERIAQQIDIDSLEEELREQEHLMDQWGIEETNDPELWDGIYSGSIDNIIDNIKVFR